MPCRLERLKICIFKSLIFQATPYCQHNPWRWNPVLQQATNLSKLPKYRFTKSVLFQAAIQLAA